MAAILGAGALLGAGYAIGIETDPYTNRDVDIADSLAILDTKLNEGLDRVVETWSRGEDERAFIDAVYRDLGGLHWVDKLERWAMDAPEVEKLPVSRRSSCSPTFRCTRRAWRVSMAWRAPSTSTASTSAPIRLGTSSLRGASSIRGTIASAPKR